MKQTNNAPLAPQEKDAEREQGRSPWPLSGQLALSRQLRHDADRLLADFGAGRGWFAPLLPSHWNDVTFMPDMELLEKDGRLIVRADLPGMKKEDVKVNVTELAVTIQGERRQDREEKKNGFYHTERSFGSFHRTIPLPEGTKPETARATFRDGVLEVIMDAPASHTTEGRPVEIRTEPETQDPKKTA